MLLEELADEFPEVKKLTGFDKCIVGVGCQHGKEDVLIYDGQKIIEQLIEDGMEEGEAIDFFEFNIACAYYGEHTPIIMTPIEHPKSNKLIDIL